MLGTLAAIGIYSMKKRPQAIMMTITNLPNTMPDIVTGISLMLLFIFAKVDRGYITMVLAHITFDVPYVVLSVMPKLKQMNKHTYEAALDLGATPGYALTHVIVPECRQGIVTGALLAFTLSLDDFTISYFHHQPAGAESVYPDLFGYQAGHQPRVLCPFLPDVRGFADSVVDRQPQDRRDQGIKLPGRGAPNGLGRAGRLFLRQRLPCQKI